MKTTLNTLLIFILSTVFASATPVYFPLLGITGSANNRDITLLPDPATNALTFNNWLVVPQVIQLHPTGGAATNNLLPWSYTMRVDTSPRSWNFVVPNSTNLQNVVNLITNALALGTPLTSGFPLVPYVTTNYLVTTNSGYTVAGAGTAPANGGYITDAGSVGGNVSWAFTNAVGSKLQYWVSAGYWNISAGGYNQAYAAYGSTNTPAGLTYQIVSGASPVPVVTAGIIVTNITGYTTNWIPIYDARLQTNANASTFFGSGQIPPQFLPASSTFTGSVTNLASVPFAVVSTTITNSTTNFLVVSGGFTGAGNYYASGGLYYGTNGYSFAYNPAAGGIWLIQSGGCNVMKMGSSNPVGSYGDNGCGAATVTQGSGTFSWPSISNSVTVTSTNFHFNITTFQNGIVTTNIYQ